jgi:hypothetical protein
MKEQTMNMLTIGLAVVVIGLLILAIMKAKKAAAEKKAAKSTKTQEEVSSSPSSSSTPSTSTQYFRYAAHPEYFRYAEDPETCSTLTNKYCMMMKDGKINNLLQPGQKILGQLQQACGKDSYMNISNCYPSWATIEGGTHDANLYPMVATVVNPQYSN